MEALQAFVLTDTQLRQMLTEAAEEGAKRAVETLRAELQQSPEQATVQKLRMYITNPSSLPSPHSHWAHAGIICAIEPSSSGKPKSTGWFMQFQSTTGLNACETRPSPVHGRRKEWNFHDIKLAWDSYYQRR